MGGAGLEQAGEAAEGFGKLPGKSDSSEKGEALVLATLSRAGVLD